MNNFSRNFVLWVVIVLFLILLFNMFQGQGERVHRDTIDFTTFQRELSQEKIVDVEMRNNVVTGRFTDGRLFIVNLPKDIGLAQQLANRGIQVKAAAPEDESPSILHVLMSWLPMFFLIGVWIFFIRQMQAGSNRALGFGRSRARLQSEKSTRVTFEDVAGIEEAKQELEEVVDFLKDPQKFQRLGGQIPRGVLLVGPPGTGKTLLARAIAGEARVPYFTISGSDFVEMFVGVGASRVRDMFEQAKKHAPCIVFIDEIDAVGRHRGAGLGGGNDEREQTLNQLLVEMDGFEPNEGVILIAATNRPDVLDPALLRPGRFDRQIVVPMPDVNGREKILEVHMRRVQVAKDIDRKVLARGTPGFSGADLANLVNEAALLAARRNKRVVTMHELEEAKDKVMMGSERRSLVMTDEEKRLTAYHEAGHAVVAYHSPDSDPIHKATIIPRGRALGMVVRLPEGDRLSMPLSKIKADLAVAMGGRIAEELIFGEDKVTTGASSDIKHATEMARRMVTEWGLSPKLGPLTYGEPAQEVFLGHAVTQHKNMSEATAQIVDEEVRRIIDEAYNKARSILTKYLKELHGLAKALLEFETLTGDEVGTLLRGESLARESDKAVEKIRKRRASVPEANPPERPKKLNPEPQPGI